MIVNSIQHFNRLCPQTHRHTHTKKKKKEIAVQKREHLKLQQNLKKEKLIRRNLKENKEHYYIVNDTCKYKQEKRHNLESTNKNTFKTATNSEN